MPSFALSSHLVQRTWLFLANDANALVCAQLVSKEWATLAKQACLWKALARVQWRSGYYKTTQKEEPRTEFLRLLRLELNWNRGAHTEHV